MQPIRLVSSFLTVGFWTLVSRVAGFVRDVLLAAYLGTGAVADAFFVAQSLPNMFRRLFAEGAFNMAFVPMFAKKYEKGDDPEGFARDAYWGMTALLLVFTVIGTLAAPLLVLAMAAGFWGDERFDLASDYTVITFCYILFISLTALLSGILNATGRFFATSFVPVLMNIVLILGMLMADRYGWPMGPALAWAIPISGVLQLAFTWAAVRRAGVSMRWRRPRLTPELKRLAIIAGPALLAGGVVQINLIISRQVASFTEGAVSWLTYADRLYQLPLGVVGIAMGVVLLPDLSRRLGAGDTAGGRNAFNRATEFALMLTIPAAVALVVIPVPLIQVLFQRGQFGADDTAHTAIALAIYAIGLPAFVLQKVLQPLFYAREDSRSPFRYALVSMAINAAFAFGLVWLIGYAAAALATTVAAWGMAWQLWRGSRRMGEAAETDERFRRRLLRVIAASVIMGVVLWVGQFAIFAPLAPAGHDTLALVLLVLLGAVTYFGIGHLIGAFKLSEFRRAVRRQP